MAFRFGTGAESSDEDGTGDISTWTTGANIKASAPLRPILQASNTPQQPDFGSEHAPWTNTPEQQMRETFSPPPASFQAINKASHAPAIEVASDSLESISLPDLLLPELSNSQESPKSCQDDLPYVVIRRNDVDASGFEDMTGGEDLVSRILSQSYYSDAEVLYDVLFQDFSRRTVSLETLFTYRNAAEALELFENTQLPLSDVSDQESNTQQRASKQRRMRFTRPVRKLRQQDGFVSTMDNIDGDISDENPTSRSVRTRKRKYGDYSQYLDKAESSEDDDDFEEPDRRPGKRERTGTRHSLRVATRRTSSTGISDDEIDELDDERFPLLGSDLREGTRRKVKLRLHKPSRSGRAQDSMEAGQQDHRGHRHSERSTRHLGAMQEVEIDDIYRSDSNTPHQPTKPKPIGVREVFKTVPRNDEFRMRHIQQCEVCNQGSNFAQLIFCQGCSLAYHKSCLGHRTNREHLVTKVGEDDFVLQCRRCVAFPRRKDRTAPDQGVCQECRGHGSSCRPFRPRKTPTQEQKDREDNDGIDPIYTVDPQRVNHADSVLFRCTNCFRAFHFEHLPSRNDILEIDTDIDAEQRFREYSRDWRCKECVNMPAKVSGIVAWKPLDEDSYDAATGIDSIGEDDKAYLVRWEGKSYFQARWMPGPWVWGVTAHSMRKAFAKRDDAQHPKMRTEEAIPEDYLRTDIVLDIKFTSIVDIRTEEVDKARIREVDKALIKYKGLSYEDAVWEAPPSPDDGDRWSDFVMAYNDWVAGRYVRQPKSTSLRSRIEKARAQSFEKLEKQSQPEKLEGGELMKYQLSGVNWLYYKWYAQENAILADEMGLGKTIQIIGFVATLVQDWNCYPFLIVVPNSTCPNWRREIKRWAPSLRVVAYYGSRESREAAYRYELYPEGSRDLRCHVVVTSYDAAADDSCRKFFRGVPWQGLIVDEGQRLKSSESQLYSALGTLKTPFKILLTGTPLQNNQRELFNLLQFLDDSFDAAALADQYQELDKDKITELHDMIRPFFLRRTKAEVLTFLPPMAQIILPVSMTIVQKKVYRSILAKNPELIRAIFSTDATAIKQTERASLNNILMQLRKCLCHPFVYNKSIEERTVSITASHRNLVDASSKLKLLEILLPKLQEQGHRVLIFSQFLDMLDIVEDFLDGMAMRYHRLDGSVNSLTKQKRIDEFNAPGSEFFAFVLSTRAGGVGINLATADTVIILDPDFNPHQDIQALSRAHRIGQTKKVLCFQLVTRASAEERIMQVGRKKLALDHVLIQEMDANDANENDLVSILRHGASELFESNAELDVVYDSLSVDRLLDRSQMEDTEAGTGKSAETQFSFARVWANDQGALEDAPVELEERAPDPSVWANILKERERVAAEEAAAKAEVFGRGRRARQNVDYGTDKQETEAPDMTLFKSSRKRNSDESDTDFQAEETDGDDDVVDGEGHIDADEAASMERGIAGTATAAKKNGKQFHSSPTPVSTPKRTKARSRNVKQLVAKPATPNFGGPAGTASAAKSKSSRTVPANSRSVKSLLLGVGAQGSSQAAESQLEPCPSLDLQQGAIGQTSTSPMKKSASNSLVSYKADGGVGRAADRPIVIHGDESEDCGDVVDEPPAFRRIVMPPMLSDQTMASDQLEIPLRPGAVPQPSTSPYINCCACRTYHVIGSCPLKLAGVEHCNLCGMAHFGHSRVCPHIQSETQVRAMLEALKYSNEPEHLVSEARRYLRSLKGNLVQLKKQKELKAQAARETAYQQMQSVAAPWSFD